MRAAGHGRLEGMHVLLTGATGSLGSELARRLCAGGAQLVLVAPPSRGLARLCAELVARGGRARAMAADLGDPVQCEWVARRACGELGRIDVLLDHAGVVGPGRRTGVAGIARSEALLHGLTAPIALARAVLPSMLRARAGHIVHLAEVASPRGAAASSRGAAVRAGLVAFSSALQRELEGTGVVVSMVRVHGRVSADPRADTSGQPAADAVLAVLNPPRVVIKRPPCPHHACTPSPTTPSAATTPWPSRASSAGAS